MQRLLEGFEIPLQGLFAEHTNGTRDICSGVDQVSLSSGEQGDLATLQIPEVSPLSASSYSFRSAAFSAGKEWAHLRLCTPRHRARLVHDTLEVVCGACATGQQVKAGVKPMGCELSHIFPRFEGPSGRLRIV